MSTFSKSPVRVARRALAAGQKMLRPYARPRSPKYTQPQLLACLVLKTFAKTDYRGIAQLLADLSDLRRVLGLCGAPPWTTLHKAAGRLLVRRRVRRLLDGTVRRVLGRRQRVKRAALDATGFETGHTSYYYARRRSKGASAKDKSVTAAMPSSKRPSTAPPTSSWGPSRAVGRRSIPIALCRCWTKRCGA